MRYLGPAKTGVSTYLDLCTGKRGSQEAGRFVSSAGRRGHRVGAGRARVTHLRAAGARRGGPPAPRGRLHKGPLPRAHLVQPPRVPLRRQPCLPRRLLDRERRTGRCGQLRPRQARGGVRPRLFRQGRRSSRLRPHSPVGRRHRPGRRQTHYAGVTVPPQSAGDSLVVRFSSRPTPLLATTWWRWASRRWTTSEAPSPWTGAIRRHAHRAQPGRTRRHGGPRPDDRRARLMDWPSSYVLDEDLDVRVRSGRAVAYEYSDGAAAEAYILESIQACDDVSSGSDELVRRIRDWPSEYHFSASRERCSPRSTLADSACSKSAAAAEPSREPSAKRERRWWLWKARSSAPG